MNLRIDSEDFEHMLLNIEKSFDIQFENNDLANVRTYGEFCDAIKSKIKLEHSDHCTVQLVFYKLRKAMTNSLDIDSESITPNTSLVKIFPRKTRKDRINKLEVNLGFKLSLLGPHHIATVLLTFLLVGSFVILFINWKYGLPGLWLSVIGFWIITKTANELEVATMEELVEKIARENYVESRRKLMTINKHELDFILENWFIDYLGIRKDDLSSGARLF